MSVKKEAERRTASTLTNSTKNVEGIERPKYPPPPRSGNAFAAAVFAAIAGLLLLMALFWLVTAASVPCWRARRHQQFLSWSGNGERLDLGIELAHEGSSPGNGRLTRSKRLLWAHE